MCKIEITGRGSVLGRLKVVVDVNVKLVEERPWRVKGKSRSKAASDGLSFGLDDSGAGTAAAAGDFGRSSEEGMRVLGSLRCSICFLITVSFSCGASGIGI